MPRLTGCTYPRLALPNAMLACFTVNLVSSRKRSGVQVAYRLATVNNAYLGKLRREYIRADRFAAPYRS